MKKFKKILVSSTLAVLVLASSTTPLFADTITTTQEMKDLREQATRTSKVIDVTEYEREMKNARTPQEQFAISKKYQPYAIETTTEYYNSKGERILASEKATPQIGSTRIVKNTYYGAQTEYDKQSSSSLSNALQLTLDIGMSWSHPVAGVLYTLLGRIVPSVEYSSYNSIITRTLYDYKVQEKFVEVYKVDPMTSIARWEPMAMSSQNETSAQVNTVYYENGIRKTPSNIDCGLVKKEVGSYFNDETRLTQLAKNATFPLSFPYTQGTTTNYKNPSVFKY